MDSCESLLVVITVKSDVIRVFSGELLHHGVNVLHATSTFAHYLRREVCVAARAIPVLEKLRGEGDGHVEVLSDTLKNIARDPQVITHGNSLDGTDLVLPLARHHFSVCAGHCDAGI